MTAFNRALTVFFDAAFRPLERLSPFTGLALLAAVTAVAVLLAFKWTADQRALARAKRGMQAAVFEMRLFNDDLVALVHAQGDVLRYTLAYLRHSLAPTLWLIAPLLVLMLHMEFHFGYTGLAVGEAALVKVRFAPGTVGAPAPPAGSGPAVSIVLDAPEAVRVETPAVLFPAEREAAWRIRPRATGRYVLRVRVGREVLHKSLVVSDAVTRRSPARTNAGVLDQLFQPSEPPLPAALGLAAITIDYLERDVSVAGWHIGWVGMYLGFTLIFAFVLKRPFKVEM